MRALVTGAAGLVGRALAGHAPPGTEVVALDRAALDITDAAGSARVLAEVRPRWVLNAAAFTDVDGCERDPVRAHEVNARAVDSLARECLKMDCSLLHFSTDYVFDGNRDGFYSVDDPTNPLSVYGASKLAGEVHVRMSGVRHLIVRTSWVYGGGGRNFLSTLPDRALERRPTRVVGDQYSCATLVDDLAEACWTLLDGAESTGHPAERVFHVANRGRVDRFTFANVVFAALGAEGLLTRITTLQANDLAPRPRSSPLDVSRTEAALHRPLPAWQDALRRHLSAISSVQRTPPADC